MVKLISTVLDPTIGSMMHNQAVPVFLNVNGQIYSYKHK